MANLFAKTAGGNWSAATTWSAVSALGVDNAGPPTAADDCIFSAGSGAVTIDSGAVCRSCDFTGQALSNYTSTITHNAAVDWTIGDGTPGLNNFALKMVAGMTYTLGSATTSEISFISTSSTQQTINGGGLTLGNITIDGSGSSYLSGDGIILGATATLTLTTGTLNTNDQACSLGLFSSSGSVTRTLTPGASAITISGTGTSWNTGVPTNLTITANTAIVTFTATSVTFSGGGINHNGMSVVANNAIAASLFTMGNGNTFANFTRTGGANAVTDTILTGSLTLTGTLTLTGNSAVNRITLGATGVSAGSTRTVTAAAVALTNVDFRDIKAQGDTLPWDGASLGDLGGNSNITFTPAVTRYWVATSGGNWNAATSWSNSSGKMPGYSIPLPQDSVVFDGRSILGINKTITSNMRVLGTNIDFSAITNNPIFNAPSGSGLSVDIMGSLTLNSNMTLNGSQAWNFCGRSSHTITTANQTFGANVAAGASWLIRAPGGTYTLQDNMSLKSGATLSLQNGIFNANNKNITVGFFTVGTLGSTKTITMGSGTWMLTGIGTVWNTSTTTGLTFNPDTSTISIAETDGAGKTFSGGGLTYETLQIPGGGTGDITIIGDNTFDNITILNPKTIKFTAGSTTVVDDLTANGASGSLIFFRSTIDNYPWYLDVNKGYSVSFVDVKGSDASSGQAIHDAPGGVDSG